jgi:hypothetical protein
MQYGILFSDEDGVPKYSGSVAHQWGASGPPSQYKDTCSKYKLVSAAKIDNWDDAVNAVADTGAPVTIASNQGFSYRCDSQGFMAAQGVWGHQMCLIGVDNSYKTPYGIILNSWGDMFEHMKDFDTGDDLPIGVIRARAEVIDSMLKAGDSWAFTEFDGFPDLSDKIDKALFDLGGD